MSNASASGTIWTSGSPRRTDELQRAEALRLLGTVSIGRIGFIHRNQPAIRVVNHLLENERIIVRTSEWSALAPAVGEGAVVAYQADAIDRDRHLGWSVVVRGPARVVSDAADVARYTERLSSWAQGQKDFLILIEPVFVSGIRLVEPAPSEDD